MAQIDPDGYQKNQTLVGEYSLKKETTSAPTAITEANLISVIMPKYNLGTQATRGGIIQRLTDHKLVTKATKKDDSINLVKNEYLPTKQGIILLQALLKSHLLNLSEVSSWEQTMSDIAEGNESIETFLTSVKATIADEIQNMPQREMKISIVPSKKKPRAQNLQTKDIGLKCPKCKKGTLCLIAMDKPDSDGKLVHYQFYGCNNSACKNVSFPTHFAGVEITPDSLQKIISGTFPMTAFTPKKGKSFQAKLIYSRGKIKMEFENKYAKPTKSKRKTKRYSN